MAHFFLSSARTKVLLAQRQPGHYLVNRFTRKVLEGPGEPGALNASMKRMSAKLSQGARSPYAVVNWSGTGVVKMSNQPDVAVSASKNPADAVLTAAGWKQDPSPLFGDDVEEQKYKSPKGTIKVMKDLSAWRIVFADDSKDKKGSGLEALKKALGTIKMSNSLSMQASGTDQFKRGDVLRLQTGGIVQVVNRLNDGYMVQKGSDRTTSGLAPYKIKFADVKELAQNFKGPKIAASSVRQVIIDLGTRKYLAKIKDVGGGKSAIQLVKDMGAGRGDNVTGLASLSKTLMQSPNMTAYTSTQFITPRIVTDTAMSLDKKPMMGDRLELKNHKTVVVTDNSKWPNVIRVVDITKPVTGARPPFDVQPGEVAKVVGTGAVRSPLDDGSTGEAKATPRMRGLSNVQAGHGVVYNTFLRNGFGAFWNVKYDNMSPQQVLDDIKSKNDPHLARLVKRLQADVIDKGSPVSAAARRIHLVSASGSVLQMAKQLATTIDQARTQSQAVYDATRKSSANASDKNNVYDAIVQVQKGLKAAVASAQNAIDDLQDIGLSSVKAGSDFPTVKGYNVKPIDLHSAKITDSKGNTVGVFQRTTARGGGWDIEGTTGPVVSQLRAMGAKSSGADGAMFISDAYIASNISAAQSDDWDHVHSITEINYTDKSGQAKKAYVVTTSPLDVWKNFKKVHPEGSYSNAKTGQRFPGTKKNFASVKSRGDGEVIGTIGLSNVSAATQDDTLRYAFQSPDQATQFTQAVTKKMPGVKTGARGSVAVVIQPGPRAADVSDLARSLGGKPVQLSLTVVSAAMLPTSLQFPSGSKRTFVIGPMPEDENKAEALLALLRKNWKPGGWVDHNSQEWTGYADPTSEARKYGAKVREIKASISAAGGATKKIILQRKSLDQLRKFPGIEVVGTPSTPPDAYLGEIQVTVTGSPAAVNAAYSKFDAAHNEQQFNKKLGRSTEPVEAAKDYDSPEVVKLQKQIQKLEAAGKSYDDPAIVKLQAQIRKLQGT